MGGDCKRRIGVVQKDAPAECDLAGADPLVREGHRSGHVRGIYPLDPLASIIGAKPGVQPIERDFSTDHNRPRGVPRDEARGKPRPEPKADGARFGTMANYGIVASARAIFMQAGDWPSIKGTMGIRASRSPQTAWPIGRVSGDRAMGDCNGR
jgi:hypothetical protein